MSTSERAQSDTGGWSPECYTDYAGRVTCLDRENEDAFITSDTYVRVRC